MRKLGLWVLVGLAVAVVGLSLARGIERGRVPAVVIVEPRPGPDTTRVRLGVDVLLEEQVDLVGGKAIGLVTNPSGVSRRLESTADLLWRHPELRLVALYAPEHGLRGEIAQETGKFTYIDDRTGLPVYVLYGNQKKPTKSMLDGVDVLVFDVQDVGARFYTYITTLSYVLEAAAEARIPVVVLDRPNPLGGLAVEGGVLEPRFSSFVGRYPLPVRHGMTVGELALLFNEEFRLGADLTVVKMGGWRREMLFRDTGLVWVPPSSAMPTAETALVYAGTCLFEGTNLSEGRGTANPFEQVGAPWIDAYRLAAELNALGLPGVIMRPTHFTPSASKHAGVLCGGVQLHVTDPRAFRPVETAVHMLVVIRRLYPADFAWLGLGARTSICFFDLLAGTDGLRRQIEAGTPVADIVREWEGKLERFRKLRANYLLYPGGGP